MPLFYPTWPTSLATKLLSVNGYQEDSVDSVTIETAMDSGPPKRRARYTAIPKLISGQFDTLSSTDVDNLLSFYDTDCVFGSIPFTWNHPRTGSEVTMQWHGKRPVITTNNSPIIFAAQVSFLILP